MMDYEFLSSNGDHLKEINNQYNMKLNFKVYFSLNDIINICNSCKTLILV